MRFLVIFILQSVCAIGQSVSFTWGGFNGDGSGLTNIQDLALSQNIASRTNDNLFSGTTNMFANRVYIGPEDSLERGLLGGQLQMNVPAGRFPILVRQYDPLANHGLIFRNDINNQFQLKVNGSIASTNFVSTMPDSMCVQSLGSNGLVLNAVRGPIVFAVGGVAPTNERARMDQAGNMAFAFLSSSNGIYLGTGPIGSTGSSSGVGIGTDGTNIFVILQSPDGSSTTNGIALTPWPVQ